MTSNKIMDFFFPTKLTVAKALEYSKALTQASPFGHASMAYTAIVLLHTSWAESNNMTLRGVVSSMDEINKKASNWADLAQSLMKEKDLFRDPGSGAVSVDLIGARGLMLQCLYSLGQNQGVHLHYVQTETLHYLKRLETDPGIEPSLILSQLTAIREERLHGTGALDQMREQILDIVKKASESTASSKVSGTTGFNLCPEDNEAFDSKPSLAPTETTEQGAKVPGLVVYDRAVAIEKAEKLMSSGQNQDSNARQKQTIIAMANNTGAKALTQIPDGKPLAELYEKFPHFTAVTSFIERRLALAACGTFGKSVKISPILLRGSPGTGKTYYCQEVARLLNLHFVEKDLSVTSEAFVIAGMDSGWKNSKPGIVFDALVEGPTANPMICLNEIDKCKTQGVGNSPMAALHWLLEPTSSGKFQDEFVPITIRADHVVWMMTANDGNIPEPILSRLQVFDIKSPTLEQCREIAQHVWKNVCNRELPVGHGFSETLSEAVLDQIAQVSPRDMRKILTDAASSAAYDGRKFVTPSDCVDYIAMQSENIQVKQSIGFLQAN